MTYIHHYQPRTSPYAHQRRILEDHWDAPGWGLLLEMGTGKSKTLIDNIFMLREVGKINRAVIVAPKGVYQNWQNKELPAHMPERHAASTNIVLWNGSNKIEELEKLFAPQFFQILIINIEAVSAAAKAQLLLEAFVAGGTCLLAIDESSTVKNPTAIRTKKLLKIAARCAYRRIMTGTPITRSPFDAWSQFEMLRKGCLGFTNIYSFKARYAVLEKKLFGGRSVQVVKKYIRLDELSASIAKNATVLRKEDVLDLPERVYEQRNVDLTPEQIKHYRALKQWAITELSGGKFVSATMAITKLLRLHQLTSGHLVSEEGDVVDVPTNRPSALLEVLEEAGGPGPGQKALVWCNYRNDIRIVEAALKNAGYKVVTYHGGTSDADRASAIVDFQDGDAEIFLATISTGGFGLTLTASSLSIFYSNGYSLEHRLQAEARNHRIGTTKSVTYVDLVCPKTIDEEILKILHAKEDLAKTIMESGNSALRLLGGV